MKRMIELTLSSLSLIVLIKMISNRIATGDIS
jgi:hypothetical protein